MTVSNARRIVRYERLGLFTLAVLPWLLALPDCFAFHAWASDYVRDTRSIDAMRDLQHARILLAAGLIGTVVSVGFCIWLRRWPAPYPRIACVVQAVLGGTFYSGDYAEPIVLLPSAVVWLPTWAVATALLLLGAVLHAVVALVAAARRRAALVAR